MLQLSPSTKGGVIARRPGACGRRHLRVRARLPRAAGASPPTPTRARSRAWPARCSCTLRVETLLAALFTHPSIDGANHGEPGAALDGRAQM
jgi:hypothetical protein